MVWLKAADDNGHERTGKLPGPGGTVRVAAGSPGGARSTVWRVWANRKSSDVYIAARDLAGVYKISLHESGDWRYQWVRRELAERYAPGLGRIIGQWPRPPAFGAGWTRGLVIWVPEPDIVPIPDDAEDGSGVRWIAKPPPGKVATFQVVVAKPDLGVVKLQQTWVLGAFSLANRETCLVLGSYTDLMPQRERWLAEQRRRVWESAGHVDLSATPAARLTLFGWDEDETRGFWDLAVANADPG